MIVGNLSSLLRWQERNFIILMLLPSRVTPCHDFTSQDLKLLGQCATKMFHSTFERYQQRPRSWQLSCSCHMVFNRDIFTFFGWFELRLKKSSAARDCWMYGDISLLLEFFFVRRDQRRMGSISGIHRSKRWTRAYFKRRCGQSCWYINKQEKIRNSVQGSYCLRNTKSSGKGFKVSTYPY